MTAPNSTARTASTLSSLLSPAQLELAKKRLLLGVSNVGAWVIAAAGVLWWLGTGHETGLDEIHLGWILASAIVVQGAFDWIGGWVLVVGKRDRVGHYLLKWSRGASVHGLILATTAALTALSIQVTGFPTTAIIIMSLGLGLGREVLLRLIAGARIDGTALGLRLVRYAHISDPEFTGGSTVLDRNKPPLLPASWENRVPVADLETEQTRRQWQNLRGLPRRSWMLLIVWNVLGSGWGWALFDLGDLPLTAALLGHAAAMTLWGFIGLLLLPSLSRGAVFAADHAAAMQGHDIRSWIRTFPKLTGEDGSANSLAQKIFYPIPSGDERIEHLSNPARLPLAGNLARDNLFYSWATLTFLGRAVHCNAGRPALWIYPPSA